MYILGPSTPTDQFKQEILVEMTIPLLQPSVTRAEIDAVAGVLRSRWWGQGPVVKQFEQELAARYGYKYCVTTNSATAALHLSLKVLNVGPGDEVIVPGLTFVSTGLAPLYVGAVPVIADVCPDTLCLDWKCVADLVTDKTRAIIPVDYAGRTAANTTNLPFKRTNIAIVQDAAHSCGGIGYGDLVCLSFHPVKCLAMGDGGAILLNDSEWANRLRALRWCGIDRSTWERVEKKYSWDYDIQEVGYKYHLNDIQAAIGLAQLHRLQELNLRRREIATRYLKELKGIVTLPVDHPQHTWHLFPIRVKNRDELVDHLLANGISAGVHYKPLTHYPMFDGDIPVTEREWKRLVSLPIFYDLTNEQQSKVIEVVGSAAEQ